MTVKSAQAISGSFCTVGATGALTAATGAPVGTLYVAGVANGAAVTVTGTNPYSWSVTLPALTAGQVVQVYITATIAGVATGGFVFEDVADTALGLDLAATLGVAGAGLTALGDARIANLDATVSSRSSHSAADVWSVATRTLTNFGTLVADVWAYGTRTLTSLSALVASIAAAVWTYATRTLTQSAAAVTAVVSGSDITVTRGDTTSISLTGLGDITGYTQVWFAVKEAPSSDADTASVIFITETGGLVYLNGAATTTPTDGDLTVDDDTTGDITITLKAALTAALAVRGGMSYDVQWKTATGEIHTLTTGTFNVSEDVARATS